MSGSPPPQLTTLNAADTTKSTPKGKSPAPNRSPVAATMVLALAFTAAAALHAWHSHRARTIDHDIMAARTQREAVFQYLAAYEHRIRVLLLPNSDQRAVEVAWPAVLTGVKTNGILSTRDLAALRKALDALKVVAQQATTPGAHALVATAEQLGMDLNAMIGRIMPPLDQHITQLEGHRAHEEHLWFIANFILVTLLASGSILFVGRLTRRLSAERAFAQRVIDTSPVAILWKDRQGRLLGYNTVFANFYGFTNPDRGLGKTARDLGMAEEQARVFDAQERYVIESGQPLINVQEKVGPPGRERWLSISRVPMHDARGRVTGVLINFTEESDRVHAEQYALEMSGRLAMGLNAAHGGEWEWNIQTHALDLSDRWLSLNGFEKNEETQHFNFFRSRVYPEDLDTIKKALDDHFAGRTSEYRAEYRMRTGDGTYRWVLGCGRVVERDAQGQPIRMQGLNLDIEPAKQAQEALRVIAERADAANRAKSDFMATMSHELRTPLSGIIGMTELLRDTALNNHQQSLVESCRFSSSLLLDLINGLLDFSKIEAGRMELDHEPFSPERCVWSAAGVMALHAHRAGLELDVEIAAGIPAMCRGDNARLRQVLVNLLANAVKFTEAGRVRVRLGPADAPDEETTGPWLNFVVIDTGIGIPPEKLPQLFEPFVQTDPSVTRRYGGTGLGLSISRSLVEAMGGRITVDSAPGRGSTFTVALPLAPIAPTVSPVPATPLKGRVLLTDPDPKSRPALRDRLKSMGLDVVDHPTGYDLRVTNVRAGDECDPRPIDGDPDPTPHLLLTPVTCPAPTPGAGPTRALTKPFSTHQLGGALRALFNGEPPSAALRTPIPAPLPDPAEPPPQSSHAEILVVEDDLTNRQYLAELLQRQGVTCDVAINGREAVAYYQKRLTGPGPAYQLVLMDYHLPEMDGWTATRAIRQAEAAHSAAPATVLGVTAASGTDDRAAGDQAGIDGWLDKPINPDALRQALATHAPPPSTAEPPLDAAAALERCMGDTHFFGATLDNFTQTLPELLDAFETALTQGDRAGAGAHAHAIKGAAGLITAFTLRDAAARCEQIGLDTSAGNLSELQQQADALRIEVQRCLQYATQIRDDVGA